MRSLPITLAILGLATICHSAEPTGAAGLLRKTAEQYRRLTLYDIRARITFVVAKSGQSVSGEKKIELAVGKDGAFRVEQESNGVVELRMSDGKTTWKALPSQKVWSKGEAAQTVSIDDDDAEAPSADPSRQDLFTQTQQAFVRRYSGLDRYATTAQIEKEDKIKLNGSKVECAVVRIRFGGSDNRLWIAKDSGLVLRHLESTVRPDGTTVQVTTDFTRMETEAPGAENFTFVALHGARETNDVALPSERNMSLVGTRASDFTLKSLDGAPVHLADLQGKIVLLDFWATWCPPCRRELPTIEALSRKYKDQGVLVYGVNNEDARVAKSFLAQHHPDLATLHDDRGKIQRSYGCYSIPTVMVIDRSGTVVAHFIGERQESELVAALKQAGLQ